MPKPAWWDIAGNLKRAVTPPPIRFDLPARPGITFGPTPSQAGLSGLTTGRLNRGGGGGVVGAAAAVGLTALPFMPALGSALGRLSAGKGSDARVRGNGLSEDENGYIWRTSPEGGITLVGKSQPGNRGVTIYNRATPGGSPPTLVTGLDRGGNIDRTQSDQYRAAMGQRGPAAPAYPSFPLTPQGQFERYFSSGSPEMDRYFGAASRGAGAPKSLEEMQALAAQRTAPTSAPLASYYRAQSAAGRGNMDEIVSALGYTGAMAEWAKANPMLAQREYNKKFPGGRSTSPFEAGAISKLNVPVGAAFANEPLARGAGTQQEPSAMNPAFTSQDLLRGANPYEMSALMGQQPSGASQGMDTSQLYGKGAPNLAAYTLPGGAFNQGTQVSAPYQQAAQMAFQRTNPENFAELTQLQQSDNDLQRRVAMFLSGRNAQ